MYNFIPGTIPNNVFVIGGGGTGGRLIPLLSQFLRSITRGVGANGWLETPRIWLIDDDVVEQKNILRQNFIERDVSKHKAIVLAERYTKAYGVEIIPITQRIHTDNAQQLYDAVNDHLFIATNNRAINFQSIIGNSIVVICVDSVKARRDILNVFIPGGQGDLPKTFFVDAGNEDNFGQVTFFTPTIVTKRPTVNKERDERELPKLCPVSADVDYVPMDLEYYRNLVDTPAQGSCADLNQTLAINAIMATTIMGILQNYFYRKPMNYSGVSISLNGGNFTTHNTYNVFNNKGVPSQELQRYVNGEVRVEEKDGTYTQLSFPRMCQVHREGAIRKLLVDKIAAERAEQERLAAVARREAEEAARAAAVKAIAERKRAEIRAVIEARRVRAAAEAEAAARGETLPPEVPVAAEAVPVEVPRLEAIPRRRRRTEAAPEVPAAPAAPRRMVELAVPPSWTPDAQVVVVPDVDVDDDDDLDDGEGRDWDV